MRILVHDFAGHAFPVQLSRELAARGHHVTHVFPEGLQGPKGRLARCDGDSPHLALHPVRLSRGFRKYSPVRRFLSQRHYARQLRALIRDEKPNVVLSGNTPVDIQAELLWRCRRDGIGFIHWVQDVYGNAIRFFLRQKLGNWAAPLSLPFEWLEKQVARKSHADIVIAPSFRDLLSAWDVPEDKVSVIENWAPLEEIPDLPRENDWRHAHGLDGKTVFLYSGTLGLKHRADLLYRLAEALDDDCAVVVVSEGIGRDYLEALPPRGNLRLFDFQPYETLPKVLAAADVLLATLASDAGFAVPSKILGCLCAGRPVLLAAPRENLAASVIERSGAGLVADPEKPASWTDAALTLAKDPYLRYRLGWNARRYAERAFDIAAIAMRFEQVIFRACSESTAARALAESADHATAG